MSAKVDARIDDYLKDLKAELRDFPATRRREILDEVQDHIHQARAELDAETEASVRTVLDRLGEPSEIASAARERFGIRPVKAGPLEVIAVIVLLFPFLGWVVGTVLLWVSRVWRLRDKVIATILVPGVWVLFFLSTFAVSAEGGSQTVRAARRAALENGGGNGHWAGWLVPLAFFVVPMVTAIYLAIRARNLSQAEASGSS